METNITTQKKNGFWASIIIAIALIFILYNGLSRISIESKVPAPTSLADSRALALYSEGFVRQAQSQSAQELAIAALSKSLANSRAIRTLAQSKAQQGQNDEALALFKLGGQLSWRDSETQLALFEQAVKNENIKDALDNIDALLRRGVAANEILSIYLLGAQDPAIATLIAEKLAQNPSWRERFFTYVNWEGTENMDSFERIISELKSTNAPANLDEVNAYVQRLSLKKSYARALNFWHDQAPQYPAKLTRNNKALLNWAHSNRTDNPFISDWKIANVDDVFPYFNDNGDEQSAVASFDLKKSAYGLLASRWVILPDSDIQLSMQSSNSNAELTSSLQWILKCINNSQQVILDPLLKQEKTWGANIDALNCDAHILEMHINPLGLGRDIEIEIENIMISTGS